MTQLPTVAVPTSVSENSIISSLSSVANLRDVLMRVYNTEDVSPRFSGVHKDTISRIVKTQIAPKLKFIPKSSTTDEKRFGSFWRPDLLQDTPKFVDAILDNFPDFADRRENEQILVNAAKFWMTSAPLIKKVLLDRRSNVTQRIKKDILCGKDYFY
jgi:hypothetical protein